MNPNYPPQAIITVKLNFGNYPPKVILVSDGQMSQLNEANVNLLILPNLSKLTSLFVAMNGVRFKEKQGLKLPQDWIFCLSR